LGKRVVVLDLVFLLAGGKVLIYLVQTFPPAKHNRVEFFRKMFSCDLCLGFWVYFCLYIFFGMYPNELHYVPFVSEAMIAGLTSYGMHLLSLGWKLKHGSFEDAE
jgi:hypothetical protein